MIPSLRSTKNRILINLPELEVNLKDVFLTWKNYFKLFKNYHWRFKKNFRLSNEGILCEGI